MHFPKTLPGKLYIAVREDYRTQCGVIRNQFAELELVKKGNVLNGFRGVLEQSKVDFN